VNLDDLIAKATYPRKYRIRETRSSLNPAIAFAMNHLASLDDDDRVLDPCCGLATLLIERQLIKPCICIGVDIDPRALEGAKENILAAEVEILLMHGDIRDKKFPNNYFTKIISNLPYGIHSGSREKNKQLYRFLSDEAINWLQVGGKAIFLTNAKGLLRNCFTFNPSWKLISETSLQLKGLGLAIFIYERVV
jgi:tRNA (guanine6-N2)-methyltransferase